MFRRRFARNQFSPEVEQLEIRVVPATDLVSANLAGNSAGDDVSYGVPEFDESRDPVRMVSEDGRYVVFTSNARNISSSPIAFDGELNQGNIYVRDRLTGVTKMVNVSIDGKGYGDSADPGITPDGRFVVFVGASYDGRFELSPLVEGITFPENITVGHQLYVRDVVSNTTTLISARPDGVGSAGNDDDVGFHASISADGSKVAFVGGVADDLVAGDSNHQADIFVRDLITGITTLISRNASGTNGGNRPSFAPLISADGTHVTFLSEATDLTTLPDTNGQPDLFSYSLADGSITLISRNAAGTAASNAGVQNMFRADDSGTKVAYLSRSTDLLDVPGLDYFNLNFFLNDLATNTTTLLSHGPDGAAQGSVGSEIGLSRDGTTATFPGNGGYLENLAEVTGQIYAVDTATGQVSLASRGANGEAGNSDSSRPILSADGRYVMFSSAASNLVPAVTLSEGPDGSAMTLFVFDRLTSTTLPVSVNGSGTTTVSTDGPFAGYYAISRDGTTLVFTSVLGGYGASDNNDVADVYAISQTPLPPNAVPQILDAVFNLSENAPKSSAVGIVQASDPDAGDTITFSIISGNQSGAFSIDSSTGAIAVADSAALDFESATTFNLTVLVTDNHGASVTGIVTVNLTDVDEVLRLTRGSGDVTWLNKQPAVVVLPQVTVSGSVALNGGMLTIGINVARQGKKLFDTIQLPPSTGLGTTGGPQFINGQLRLQILLGPNATNESLQAFLRGITFATKSKGVQMPTRTVSVTLTASGQTASASQTIQVRKK